MEFIDLKSQYLRIKGEIDQSIQKVLNQSNFIQGNEVKDFEKILAEYVSSSCVSCANGTDAIYIALRALGIRPGDEVIVPSFTWVSTAEVVKLLDAVPIFAEVDETFNINSKTVSKLISPKTKGIIAVSMFGTCPNLFSLKSLADEHDIFLIEDAAQSFGAKHQGKLSCSIADVSTTSFFPAKPLGCYGDGGAIFSNNADLIDEIDAISKHGQKGRYNYVTVGMNSRLDTIQAAILIEKMKIFEDEILTKNHVAKTYNECLVNDGLFSLPLIPDLENRSVWAQYTLILEDPNLVEQRSSIMDKLKDRGIPTALYYPAPLHLQKPYLYDGSKGLPVTERISKSVISFPMHAYLSDNDIHFISDSLFEVIGEL